MLLRNAKSESDIFKFKIAIKDRLLTRRGILSMIGSMYNLIDF